MTTGGAVAIPPNDRIEPNAARWMIAFPLVAAAIAFAWILYTELVRLYGMTASAWDVAINQHVIWNVSVGQGFYTSFQRANFLGIHFEADIRGLWP